MLPYIRNSFFALIATSLTFACTTEVSPSGAAMGIAPDGGPDGGPNPIDAVAILEVHALDLWGQILPAEGTTLTVSRGDQNLPGVVVPLTTIVLQDAGNYAIHLEAEGHVALDVSAIFDGTHGLGA